tara:strand:- start:869 stop:1081 length:213 start_codon:yes stop_codon:yes gene_type:complete
MWMPIILVCTAPYVQSCNIITGMELLRDQNTCFAEASDKATLLLERPNIYMAKPACQILPTTIKEKEMDI